MAKQIVGSFTIKVSEQPGAYIIEASGPRNIRVEPHPFIWAPTPQEQDVIEALHQACPLQVEQLIDTGQMLYRAVFTPSVERAFGMAQGRLKGEEGIRVRLQIEPPEFTTLPWELMHDGQDFLSLKSNYPLVRTESGIKKTRRTVVSGKLRILYVGASPTDMATLNIEHPAQEIKRLLEKGNSRRRFEFTILLHATLSKLQSALLKDPHVLCFAGHGDQSYIYLENGIDGKAEQISIQTVARQLEGKNLTRMIFLAACETAPAALALAQQSQVPAILAMQYPIGDEAANQLTACFFETLATFRPADAALSEARKSIIQDQRIGRDLFAPVMYLQSETSNLFQRARNWVALVFAAAFIAATIVGIGALLQAQENKRQANIQTTQRAQAQATAQAESVARSEAENSEQIARAHNLAAQVVNGGISFPQSAELAIEAYQLAPISSSKSALWAVLTQPFPQFEFTYDSPSTLTAGVGVPECTNSRHSNPWSPDGTKLYFGGLIRDSHTGEILDTIDHTGSPEWSPDGRLLIIDPGFSPSVLNAESGRELFTLGAKWSTWVSNARLLFRSDNEDVLKIWDVGSARVYRNVECAAVDDTRLVSVSSNGDLLATSNGLRVQICDAETGDVVSELNGRNATARFLIFNSNGSRIATVDEDGMIRIWDPNTGSLISSLAGDTATVSCISWATNERIIATIDSNAIFPVWDSSTGERIEAHYVGARAITISPDGKWILGQNGKIWSTSDDSEVAGVNAYLFAFWSPDGGRIFSDGSNDRVWIWNVAWFQDLATELESPDGNVGSRVFVSPDGEHVASVDHDNTLRLWKITTEKPIWTYQHPDHIDRIVYDSTGTHLFSITGDHGTTHSRYYFPGDSKVRVWDISSGYLSYTLEGFEAAWSPEGTQIATLATDDMETLLHFWDVETGNRLQSWAVPADSKRISYSPHGKYILVQGDSGSTIWNSETGVVVAHGEDMSSAVWDPDGSRVAGIEVDSSDVTQPEWSVHIWDVDSGDNIIVTGNNFSRINSLVWSPDGEYIAVARGTPPGGANTMNETGQLGDTSVRLWNVQNRSLVGEYMSQYWVSDVMFSSDSSQVLALSGPTALLLDGLSLELLHSFTINPAVTSGGFSTDGERLILGGGGLGRIQIWHINSDYLFQLARDRLSLFSTEVSK
ncbi:MAG: CHAT domain-containing protein [Anaerolineae bacterium]|nr:CHAT domain-containing protein [Anaerolineae bacterium]